MKKKKLNEFLNIVTNWNEQNSEIRDDLLFGDRPNLNKSLDQFSSELGENISTLIKIKRKRELIKFYIQQFDRALSISDENRIIWENSKSLDDLVTNNDKRNKHSITYYNDSGDKVHKLFVIIFNEIQFVCIQHNIPFLEICKEVNFPLNMIIVKTTRECSRNEDSGYINVSAEAQKQSESQNDFNSALSVEDNPQKRLRLRNELKLNGFDELDLVKCLSIGSYDTLMDFICSNKVPYKIAMLDYLGFIRHFTKKYGLGKKELCEKLGRMLLTSSRTIQGNINVLYSSTGENKKLFTSHSYINTVKEDYQKVK